ncbi:MAG: hypothetical protein ACETWG_07620 [Candidatus Neomarinimicrobiota bacterium]
MRVLTINSHQPYVYDLAKISGIELFIIDQLPGRPQDKWDQGTRPLPANAKLLRLEEALSQSQDYDVFLAHNLTDISITKTLAIPRVLLIHSSLDGLLATQTTTYSRNDIHRILQTYIRLKQVMLVSVSTMKAASWGITNCIIVPFAIDTDFFQGYYGEIPRGLRVANQLISKREVLNLDFFTNLIEGFDIRLVGNNPKLDSKPARSQDELLKFYQSYRYYIHTAREGFEDGYNLSSLEAMATGMPIVCNQHPSSPIVDSKNGFMSDDVGYLQAKMRMLEGNLDFAKALGVKARSYVVADHSLAQFERKWAEIFELAIKRFKNNNTAS